MIRSLSSARVLTLAALAFGLPALSAQIFSARDRQPTPAELSRLPAVIPATAAADLKEVRVPSEFEVTIFATPPAVNYPVFVAASTDGTLYVSSDGNGSLDRKPHLGRVLRVRDTNGDGQADEVKAFVADVDSPRGLVWDHDRLYLLHPPDVSVFVDADGDGIAEERRTLVKGIGWTFKERPADHGSNGLTLGIDGWLYAAIGDFGFMEAVGTDGRKLQMRGGGVVRFRPDGSGLETWAEGTRNILEVAMSPALDGFTRDNTNDGGGWDIRLHHFSGWTDHGYPRLFKNFGDEIIQPLADYGGGSGCGAAWIGEPGIPDRWNNAPLTADWGRDWIYHHGLTRKGTTFVASQEEFIRLPRVTDLDVDGNGAIYAASWKGASFTWVGPEVGFIAKVTPKGHRPEPMPDFGSLNAEALVKQLESTSHRRRLEAQRTLLRRVDSGALDGKKVMGLLCDTATGKRSSAATKTAALATLGQMNLPGVVARLARMSQETELAPAILRALGSRKDAMGTVSLDLLKRHLASTDPKLRLEAVNAAVRVTGPTSASALVRLLDDSDSLVVHATIRALVGAQSISSCFTVLDDHRASSRARVNALMALQRMHQMPVVEGLIRRLESESAITRRAGILTALCRLHSQEGVWKGDSWGTRPDTRGPYYQPETWNGTLAVVTTLRGLLNRADSTEAAFIGREMSRHRIPAGDGLAQLIRRAATEASLLPAIAAQLSEAEEVPAAAVPLLIRTATGADTLDAARAQAVIALIKTVDASGWRAVLEALPKVQKTVSENNLAEKASAAFRSASKMDQVHAVFEEVAARADGPASVLAEGMVLRLASRKLGAPEVRAAAEASLNAGWAHSKRRLQILRAAVQVGDASRVESFVAALSDADPAVAKAAKETLASLKIDPAIYRARATLTKVGEMKLDEVLEQVMRVRGDAGRGGQLFGQVGCTGCHTVKQDEPIKGPYLGSIATLYKRRELAEAVLYPNKTLAQGFVANHFELKDGSEVDGFVVREAADAVTLRTIAAVEQVVQVSQIVRREKQERSLMPEGLVSGLTLVEFASLLDYLEALSAGGK